MFDLRVHFQEGNYRVNREVAIRSCARHKPLRQSSSGNKNPPT
jgi:hypothetical protein